MDKQQQKDEAGVCEPQMWMVALDDSPHSFFAFKFACASMDPKKDHLLLVSVASEPSGYFSMIRDIGSLIKGQVKQTKRILAYYDQAAAESKIRCTMILGQGKHVGEILCNVAESFGVNHLICGRRSLAEVKRLLVGSTSRYVVENANCNVAVVKEPQEEVDSPTITEELLSHGFSNFRIKTRFGQTVTEFKEELEHIKCCDWQLQSKDTLPLYIFRTDSLKRKEVWIYQTEEIEREIEPLYVRTEQREVEKKPIEKEGELEKKEKRERKEKRGKKLVGWKQRVVRKEEQKHDFEKGEEKGEEKEKDKPLLEGEGFPRVGTTLVE